MRYSASWKLSTTGASGHNAEKSLHGISVFQIDSTTGTPAVTGGAGAGDQMRRAGAVAITAVAACAHNAPTAA